MKMSQETYHKIKCFIVIVAFMVVFAIVMF